MTVSEVKQSTHADTTLQAIIEALRNNSWHSTFETPSPLVNSQDLHALYNIRDELCVSDDHDLLLRSHRLILPHALRQRALHIAHEGNQGLTKTKQLLRENIWFPGIDGLRKSNLASQGLLPTLGCGEDPGSGWSRETFIYSPPWGGGGWVEHQWCKNRLPVENSVFRRFEGVKRAKYKVAFFDAIADRMERDY